LNTSLQTGSALGLAALAAIASIVTRNHQPGHTMATALTDGYVVGLVVGAIIVALGALVALFTINARLSATEAAGHRATAAGMPARRDRQPRSAPNYSIGAASRGLRFPLC